MAGHAMKKNPEIMSGITSVASSAAAATASKPHHTTSSSSTGTWAQADSVAKSVLGHVPGGKSVDIDQYGGVKGVYDKVGGAKGMKKGVEHVDNSLFDGKKLDVVENALGSMDSYLSAK